MKRALKLTLALFLFSLCLFIGLNTKTSAKADTQALNEYFYLKTTTRTTQITLTGTIQGVFLDSDNNRIVFYIPALHDYINISYYVARYYYSGGTVYFYFYDKNTQDLYTQPGFYMTFKANASRYNNGFAFTGVYSANANVEMYITDIITAFSNGFQLATLIDNGTGQPASNILDNTSYSYYFLTNCLYYGPLDTTYIDAYTEGQNSVIDDPNAYYLYTVEEFNSSYTYGYNTGYGVGYDAGFIDGEMADPSQFEYNNILKTVFNTASNILNLSIVGPLKLIHFIILPLLLGLFAIVLKVFRS